MRRGAIGIGTLIVFIAMVLVAAVAAGVLIATSSYLQQKAMSVGRETTMDVSSGIRIVSIWGYAPTKKTGNSTIRENITKMIIYIAPNAGSTPININSTKIILSTKAQMAVLAYKSGSATSVTTGTNNLFNSSVWSQLDSTTYGIIALVDEDQSLTANKNLPTLNQGDLAAILIYTEKVFSDYKGLPPNTKVVGKIIPSHGAGTVIDFITPPAFTETTLELQ